MQSVAGTYLLEARPLKKSPPDATGVSILKSPSETLHSTPEPLGTPVYRTYTTDVTSPELSSIDALLASKMLGNHHIGTNSADWKLALPAMAMVLNSGQSADLCARHWCTLRSGGSLSRCEFRTNNSTLAEQHA